MKKTKKKNLGGRPFGFVTFPADPNHIKKASTRTNLVKGLGVLDSLWSRSLFPDDLKKHYYLTWLAYWNGNLKQMAKTLDLDKRNLIWIFQQKLKQRSTFKLRLLWKAVEKQKENSPFNAKVHDFYKQVFKQPRFSKSESEGLSNLWLMGLKRKDTKSHFFIWFTRKGQWPHEIAKKFRTDVKTVRRFRAYALREGSPAQKWLEHLKLKREDWYLPKRRKNQ